MTDSERLSGRVGLDTTDFKSGLAEMNRELRVLESGFRASAAELGDWSGTASGLEQRIKSLSSQIDIQKNKVAAIRSEYQRVKEEKGANSRAAQDLEIKLNKETETLGKMNNELDQSQKALDDMDDSARNAGKGMDEAGRKTQDAGDKANKAGNHWATLGQTLKNTVKAVVAMTVAVAAMVVGLAAATIGPASDLNETVSKTEVVFGDAADKVLAFGDTAATSLGLSKNAALGAASTYGNLLRAMGLTEDQSADMSTSLVGLAADLASFNNLDPTEVTEKLRAGLTGEAEPLKALGVNLNQARIQEKALELGLIKKGEALDAAAKAQAAYAIIMEDTTLAQGDFARTSDGLANQQRIFGAQLEDTKAKLGTGFLPIVTQAMQTLNGFLGSASFAGGLEEVVGLVSQLGDVLSLAFGENANFADFSEGLGDFVSSLVGKIADALPQLVETGTYIISAIVKAIVGALPQLLTAGISIVTTLLLAIISLLPTLVQAGVQLLLTLVQAIIDNLPMLIDAAFEAILAIALGIAEALPELIPSVVEAILVIVDTLIDNIPLLITAAISLILGLANGLIAALPNLIEKVPQILQSLVDAIIANLPVIGQAALQLILALLNGIVASLPQLGQAASSIVNTLKDGVIALVSTVWDVGKNIILGVWEGISSQADWFWDQISGFFSGIVDGVLDLLGINSPSKVFGNIGLQSARGFFSGFADEFRQLEPQLYASFRGLTASPAFASGQGGAYSNNQESFAFYAPVYFQGNTAPNSLGSTIKAKRY